MHDDHDGLCLLFEGEAGQGIQTVTAMLLSDLNDNGFHLFSCTEYMSRIRGGSNTTEIRITEKPRSAYRSGIDVLFAMSPLAFEHLEERLSAETLIFADRESTMDWHENFRNIPLKRLSREAGGALYTNTIVAAAALGLLGMTPEHFTGYLKERFAGKGSEVVSGNIKAAELGYKFIADHPQGFSIKRPLPMPPEGEKRLLMDGTSALGIGAVLAGCNFISSYPMSPGTGLLTFLASKADDFGIVVDQAEDEIAAINSSIGASYAGARAIVTTSGGGFDLMQEGVSLAGMIETPVVIHIGQRPGPATGLPTRTEQGDLRLALNAGHGDFERAIFAPGSTPEIIETIQRAFELAQRFQIPVFILTDQYLLDSVCQTGISEIRRMPVETTIVETGESYRRYEFTEDGLSPRGVPGYGTGIVRVDSDEHDEAGLITESFEMRRRMVEKRLKRLQPLREVARPPTRIGHAERASTLVVCWGSNRGVVEEAVDRLNDDEIAGLHFTQVWPLSLATPSLLATRRIVVVENNATGQFADLLTRETGHPVDRRILKANGEPFSIEELLEELNGEGHGRHA